MARLLGIVYIQEEKRFRDTSEIQEAGSTLCEKLQETPGSVFRVCVGKAADGPCSAEAMSCSTCPTPQSLYSASPWHAAGNALHPAPRAPAQPQSAQMTELSPGEGPRKVKGFLALEMRQARLGPTFSGFSLTQTLLKPGAVGIFVLFYIFSIFLSPSNHLFSVLINL